MNGSINAHLRAAHERVTVGGMYRHYKDPDSRYRVKELALLEAGGEVVVVYESLNDGLVWVRPLEAESGWLTKVVVAGKEVERFERVAE